MGLIKFVGGIIGVLVVVGALSKDKPGEAVSVGASVGKSILAQTVTPEPPSLQCPAGYAAAGSRGCFTVDSISNVHQDIFSARGKVISKDTCNSLIVELSATDAGGAVICDGNGIVSDVAGGKSEAWSGSILNCDQKPTKVSLKLTCI